MNHFKYLISSLSLLIIVSLMIFAGCGGDDSVNTTAGGWPPTFNFKQNAIFVYTTDSLLPGGVGSVSLHRGSTDVVQAQTTIAGQVCFPFLGSTHDTTTNQTTPDLYYVRYDPAGYYYQYGIKRLIDTTQTPTWDLIGDFTKARGTSYSIGSINYTIPLPPPYGNINFSGPLTGSIADSTTIQTTSLVPQTIYCYRIELKASISGTYSGQPVTADIYLDYYVGYTSSAYPNNPAGLVELKSRPFSFSFAGTPVLPEPGFDRKLYSYTP